ncbi:MAG: pyridine nucleotide-disulfide oxidoreductase [Ignavibacteria bacterium]|nr:pyridine nucleotide-disulfide oxidoreductase [Ignavibacteria bacterium]
MDSLQLTIPNFSYQDLYNSEKLSELTHVFYSEVQKENPKLFQRFDAYRLSNGHSISETEISSLLVEMASYVNDFVARLFGIENEIRAIKKSILREQIIFQFKKEFFVRRTLKKIQKNFVEQLSLVKADEHISSILSVFPELPQNDFEYAIASLTLQLLEHDTVVKTTFAETTKQFLIQFIEKLRSQKSPLQFLPQHSDVQSIRIFLSSLLSFLEQWLAAHFIAKTKSMNEWITFKIPQKIDYAHLIEFETTGNETQEIIGKESHYRRRNGFDLTDTRYSLRETLNEVDYCIFCHEREKDSCSKGFHENNVLKKNPLDYELKGCPLEQKISESHLVEQRGDIIGALAIIAIDNPMCPGTGHRICNDCMKSCIYQKQEPVNIPQIETRILTDVLHLPWGFEIYSLLTRWNPLNIERPFALPYNGKKILVVGLGPAGYTLSHYLLNEGFGVVGVDGLKIESLPTELVGNDIVPFSPIKDFSSLTQNLSERIYLGFGGVSEYGITVRWDKNFLTVIYLNLLRRERFRVYDGVRFGGTLTVEDAWDLGFDHVCFATGAGKPTFVSMKNNLIRGIRKASDFLMALQLTGAGKKDSMANLQIQLPAIVIGGGLTAIDTATEVMAYYPIQVEKIKKRYGQLCAIYGKENIDILFDKEEKQILETFLLHANALENERCRASENGEQPNFIPLLRAFGGVHIYYRKSINDSPAYRLNHEEIIKGLEEGIFFVEKMSPVEAIEDEYGAVSELIFEKMNNENGKWKTTNESVRIKAKSVFVAAGTVPNIMYEREHPGTFQLDEWGEFFQSFDVFKNAKQELLQTKKGEIGFFTSYERNGKYVTFYGDNHPAYEGNIVKAMSSAKAGYKKVLALFEHIDKFHSNGNNDNEWKAFAVTLDNALKPYVVKVERLTSSIIEVVVHAPIAAKQFLPGQFFRLQNYERDAKKIEDTLLMMEGVALTGAWVDTQKGLLSMIILEMGASSKMCGMLQPGQRIVLMGPTGTPTEIPENTTALLLGGGLGNAVLFSIAKAMKEKNNKVIYFAGYKKKEDVFKQEEIEAYTDVVVYSVDSGEPISLHRKQDKSFVGNIVQAMLAYAKNELGEIMIPLHDATRIIAIGSDKMMAAVTSARHSILKPFLNEQHVGIASINSPMQCMMKAICAQCLQRHIDQKTGKEEFIFSCYNQDQCMDDVDFKHLSSRLKANTVMEKIANQWIEYLSEMYQLERV